jgi:hypothetical protein
MPWRTSVRASIAWISEIRLPLLPEKMKRQREDGVPPPPD